MDKRIKYLIIIVLSFILYGNTLFHDYTLDDAIVITENEYTLNGFDGLKDIFSEDVFNGFFEQKNKKLVIEEFLKQCGNNASGIFLLICDGDYYDDPNFYFEYVNLFPKGISTLSFASNKSNVSELILKVEFTFDMFDLIDIS